LKSLDQRDNGDRRVTDMRLLAIILISIFLNPILNESSLAFSRGQSNRHEGILKIKYSSGGKKYKACCQGYGGLGPCSEEGSLYTISYDLNQSAPGDPCTYADMNATPAPSMGPKKTFQSTVD